MRLPNYRKTLFLCLFLSFTLVSSVFVRAQTVDDLKAKIDDRSAQIKKLEAEIKQYSAEVTSAQSQAKTLQNTLKTLDLTKKKITTDITLTEKKIDRTTLTIGQLNTEIDKTAEDIDVHKRAIMSAIQNTRIIEDTGMLALILSKDSIGDIWRDMDDIKQIQNTIVVKSRELGDLKDDMETKQENLTGQRKDLVGLKQDLSGKKQVVEVTTQEKATILAQTKNKEQVFKQLVQTKEQEKAKFEKELFEFESQLHFDIDRGSYPSPRNGIISWPLDDVFVTQKFGKTVGSETLYRSGSHSGVDFRASIGTPIKTVLGGVVVGTGNTDLYPGCYSFGKWVLVRHENGLSTAYGHLSVISATAGQTVATGDVIGYSGNTGHTTGPHLHITLYATQGVKIEKYLNGKGCKNAVFPIADTKAYLDPLAYFPNI